MEKFAAKFTEKNKLVGHTQIPQSTYENDYEKLKNLPSINGVELKKGMEAKDLGLQEAITMATKEDIENIFHEQEEN